MQLLPFILAASLNPLVVRAPEPVGPVPADCSVSGVAAVARVETAATEEAMPLPPVKPTATARSAASDRADLARALAANDRQAFDEALAHARDTGGARRAYEDIARVWDAQFESPFFGRDSEAYRIASGHPGWEAAVRRQTITDDRGVTLYPAAETRAYLAKEAGLTRGTTARRSANVRPSRTAARTGSRRSSSSSRSRTPAPRKAPAATEAPHPIPPVAARTAKAEPAPVVPAPAAQTATAEAPPAAGVTTPATSAPVFETTATQTAATETAATHTAAPATPSQPARRSLVMPIILILIGLGVLVLLFRTAA